MSQQMSILEILKRIKHIDRKLEKIKTRVAKWSSYSSMDLDSEEKTPPYDVNVLVQQAQDLRAFRGRLRHAMHKANLSNKAEYRGKMITLDELLILRTVTLPQHKELLQTMRRKEKNYAEFRYLTEEERKEIKIIVKFDPTERDKAVDAIDDDIANIDSLLD